MQGRRYIMLAHIAWPCACTSKLNRLRGATNHSSGLKTPEKGLKDHLRGPGSCHDPMWAMRNSLPPMGAEFYPTSRCFGLYCLPTKGFALPSWSRSMRDM